MHKNKKYFLQALLIPVLLFITITGCQDDRMGITFPSEITAPMVSSTNPLNAATGENININIAVTFSEVMDISTINTSTFMLKQGTSTVSGIVSYSGLTAIFSPAENLAPNTTYTGTITTGVNDDAGNSMETEYAWSFTTGSSIDNTSPIISFTDPANASTDVALNKKISVTFSEEINDLTINTTTFTINQGVNPVPGSVVYSGTTAIFSPAEILTANTTYTGTITTGVSDLAGNALANNYVWSFTTGSRSDITAPSVSSTDPFNSETDVALNKIISAYFTEAMDASTITTATYTIMQSTSFVSGTVSYLGSTAIFTPSSNLAPNTTYTGTITTGAKDLANNGMPANYVWSFTTGTVQQLNVNLTSNPAAGGQTSGGGSFSPGSSVTVSASANSGYIFTNWTEGLNVVSSDADYTFILNDNRTLSANFITGSATYTVTLSSNPLAGGTTSGGGTFDSGSSVTINASANSGYTFTNWTEGINIVSNDANYTFNLNNSRTIVANFIAVALQYTAVLSSNPLAGGTTSGGGLFNSGADVTVEASPNSGYTFVNWTEGINVASTESDYTFSITSNRILVANFSQNANMNGIDLGSAGDFAILAGAGVTSTGLSTVFGDVGAFPTATINGFPPGTVVGILYTSADPIVGLAKDDLTTAYNEAQGRSLNAISLPGQLGGLTLVPGLYVNSTSTGISGTGSNAILTLDAGGNANAVWIFKMGSTLITDPGTSIVLAGGAKWENIYWSVGSSATLGTNSIFYGNILADQAISLNTGAALFGRALTRIAAVTLQASIVDKR